MFRILALTLGAALAFAAPAARACSVLSDYVVPSNFELVQLADAIVVATPLSQGEQDGESSLRFRVDAVLKGGPPSDLTLLGLGLGDVALGDANALLGPHPDAGAGGCIRRTFRTGQPAVLFLKEYQPGRWAQLGYPFARVNEDYFGPDALWPRTVRQYLDIQARNDPMQELAVLERMLLTELTNPHTEEERERARDILSHLMSRSEWKPTRYLVETYETLERGEAPRFSFRPRAADQEQSRAQVLTELVFGDHTTRTETTAEQQRFVLTNLVRGEHPEAAALFERIVANAPQSWQLGMAVRFYAKNGQYRRAFALIEREALAMLVTLPREAQMQLISDIVMAQHGDSYEEGSELWRVDPYTAERWPQLALALRRYEISVFGRDNAHPFTDALSDIPLADFRANREVTLTRAENFDEEVEAWAIAQIADVAQRTAWEALSWRERGDAEDPALLPLQALMVAYGEERDAGIERAYCQSAERRMLVIEVLGELGGELDTEFAARIAADRRLTGEEREAIGRAVAQLFTRELERGRGELWGGADEEYELLGRIQRRERVEAEPFRCARR